MARPSSYGARIRSALAEASQLPDPSNAPDALQAIATRFGVDLADLTRRAERAVADRTGAAPVTA